jgi:hypothetical protein
MKTRSIRLLNFRSVGYRVAILCWLAMMYVAAQRAYTGEESMLLLLGTFSLGGLTFLVLDSVRRTRRR